MITTTKGSQRPTRADRESIPERRTGGRDGGSISCGVRDHDDHVLHPGITSLEFDPTKLRLHVVEPGLGLSRDNGISVAAASKASDDAIPGAKVVLERQRNLRPESQIGMQALAEPRQECRLGGVADRIGPGICANADVEADDRTDLGQLDGRDSLVPGSLDASDLPSGQPDESTNLFHRQAGTDPGSSKVGPDGAEVAPRDPRATIGGTLSCWHRASLAGDPSPVRSEH